MMVSFMSCILGLLGLALAVGGTKLAMLGGSLYYIITGVALLVTALLMFRRKAAALWLYAAIVVGTLAWAVWEVGFDWWQLAPRGGILVLIALILCLPVFRRDLGARNEVGAPRAASALPVAAASVVSIVVAGYSLFQEPSRIIGELPTEKLTAEANTGNPMEDGEWHQYGRTNYGQRWSPLEQITPANVADLELAWQY